MIDPSLLPALPELKDDPQGVQAQETLRLYAQANANEDTARLILGWLKKASTELYLRQFKAGIDAQTRKDIENLRSRLNVYIDWLDDGVSAAQLDAWVLGPLTRGDFANVPDTIENSPYKLPGIFDTAIDGQTEVARLYQLSTAVDLDRETWKKNVQEFFLDVGNSIGGGIGKIGEKAEDLETAIYVVGGGALLFGLYRVLR